MRRLWNLIKFLWSHLCFALRQILVFCRNFVKVIMVIAVILFVLGIPANRSRNSLKMNLEHAFQKGWNNQVLDLHFSVDPCILYRRWQIETKVKEHVENWNIRVKQDLRNEKAGFVVPNDIPYHTVRAFYTDGIDNKGPTVWLVSDNVSDIPLWLIRSEIK